MDATTSKKLINCLINKDKAAFTRYLSEAANTIVTKELLGKEGDSNVINRA